MAQDQQRWLRIRTSGSEPTAVAQDQNLWLTTNGGGLGLELVAQDLQRKPGIEQRKAQKQVHAGTNEQDWNGA